MSNSTQIDTLLEQNKPYSDPTFLHNHPPMYIHYKSQHSVTNRSYHFQQQLRHLTPSSLLAHLQSLTKWFNLTFLDLHGLSIEWIDSETFQNFTQLKTLILSANHLSYLSEKIFYPIRTQILHLNIQRNHFHTLNSANFLHYLKRLKILDFSTNYLKEISITNFVGIRRLESLILRKNQIQHLPYAVFSRMTKLSSIDLSDNQIFIIDEGAFKGLKNLKVLILMNNPLGKMSIKQSLFYPLINLEFLDLENCQLYNLPSYLFSKNLNLRSIKLRRNNFQIELIEVKSKSGLTVSSSTAITVNFDKHNLGNSSHSKIL
ncbi:unnamed protein product [Didymodactylos carnosus]|uniref:Uncharacterized protein n=1 Tax=Didymodactylos carnosus TaxID=1234261 RepID=A0A8S2E3G0_9BILA|nr:unnamed protein product [Didymodactylos carnosus]CAF3814792.1 unnamed protein product [Didymodactylos carnosus]